MGVKRDIGWGRYEGIRKFETPQELPPEYRDFITKLLYVQGDTEFASIQQHRPWLDRAPTAEDRLTQARVVMDEMRHGWQMCHILKDFDNGEELIQKLLEKKPFEHKLDSFNIPFESWADVVAFACIIDRVGIYQLQSFEECSYGPLSRAIPLMLVEEQLHITFGRNGLRRVAKEDKKLAQEMVYKWYPRALDMFGHSNSEGSKLAVELGIKRRENEEARQKYIEETTKVLNDLDLEVPPPDYDRRIL